MALLTTAQAAKELGVTRQTIVRYVVDGKLRPYMKTPGRTGGYLFTRGEIDRFRAPVAEAS